MSVTKAVNERFKQSDESKQNHTYLVYVRNTAKTGTADHPVARSRRHTQPPAQTSLSQSQKQPARQNHYRRPELAFLAPLAREGLSAAQLWRVLALLLSISETTAVTHWRWAYGVRAAMQ